MFSFGSGDVNWSSKKQPTIALSSTKAEYKGAAIVTCEVVWLQKLLSDLGPLVDAHVVIYCDNISSILLANTRSIMLGQSTLRCTTILLEKKF